MKAWQFCDGFGRDNLILTERKMPCPGQRDVLIEILAASLNWRDLVVMRGAHGRSIRPPLIPLSDGVGRVIAKGAQVKELDIGERVCPAFYQHWQGGPPPANLAKGRLGGPLDGVLASHRVFPASGVVRVPDHLSDAEAATLPCAGVTAWSALSEPSPIRPGETVLILGSGGVALNAIALARIAGARVIAITSSTDKAEQLKKIGADHAINRQSTPGWARCVRELTGGLGADRVLELGGAATLNESVKAVRTGGTIILIGNVTGDRADLFLPPILTRRITLHSVSCGSVAALRDLCQAVDRHRLRPMIGKIIAFNDAPLAFDVLEKGYVFGKVCIACSEKETA